MSNEGPLAGKTALVTGGALRLGRAICSALAAQGVHVIVHYRSSKDAAESLAETLRETDAKAWTISANLESPEEAGRLVDRALELSGELDFIVNNAAIFPRDTLEDLSTENLFQNLSVNALSPLIIARAFSARGGTGAIVNLLDARVTDYDREHVSYHLSKRMLLSLTRMMAAEFAPAVRVNAIAPGLILPPVGEDESYLEALADTNYLKRVGSPEDVCSAVLFLLASEFITGQTLYVDGGRHMKGNFYG
ncbi:MAG: SDR family oxidoreductase [Candidatus Hydrogenedentes bacterium]|nr:SDR family oxidoreductase [Candidatus Hydrogenedentota bacterium]